MERPLGEYTDGLNVSNMTEMPPGENVSSALPGINESNEEDRENTINQSYRSSLVDRNGG
jgi:hypothetical protein